MAGKNSVARIGGARATNGTVAGFNTSNLPAFADVANSGKFDVSDYVQVVVAPASIDRRAIFQEDDTDVVTNIQGDSSFLILAGESWPFDCIGDNKFFYIAGATTLTDGIRLIFFDET